MTENFAESFSALFKLALQSSSENETEYLKPRTEKARRLKILQPFVSGFIDAVCSQGLHSSDLLLAQAVYYRTLAGEDGIPQYRLPGRIVGALLHAAAREAEIEGMELP